MSIPMESTNLTAAPIISRESKSSNLRDGISTKSAVSNTFKDFGTYQIQIRLLIEFMYTCHFLLRLSLCVPSIMPHLNRHPTVHPFWNNRTESIPLNKKRKHFG